MAYTHHNYAMISVRNIIRAFSYSALVIALHVSFDEYKSFFASRLVSVLFLI